MRRDKPLIAANLPFLARPSFSFNLAHIDLHNHRLHHDDDDDPDHDDHNHHWKT